MKKLVVIPLLLLFVSGCCMQTIIQTFGFLYDPDNPRIVSINESEPLPTPDWWGRGGDEGESMGTLVEVSDIGGDYGADYCIREGQLDPANPFRGFPAKDSNLHDKELVNGEFCMNGYVGSWEHEGIDMLYWQGVEVVATAEALVVKVGTHPNAGNFVDLCSGIVPGWCMRYMHLSEVLVSQWDTAHNRQVIGKVGGTGEVTGVHLHYDIRYNEQFHDPYCTLQPGLCP